MLYWKWVHESGLQQTSEVIDGLQGDLSKLNSSGDTSATSVEKTHFMLGQLYESLVFPHRNARVDERRGGGGCRVWGQRGTIREQYITAHSR